MLDIKIQGVNKPPEFQNRDCEKKKNQELWKRQDTAN